MSPPPPPRSTLPACGPPTCPSGTSTCGTTGVSFQPNPPRGACRLRPAWFVIHSPESCVSSIEAKGLWEPPAGWQGWTAPGPGWSPDQSRRQTEGPPPGPASPSAGLLSTPEMSPSCSAAPTPGAWIRSLLILPSPGGDGSKEGPAQARGSHCQPCASCERFPAGRGGSADQEMLLGRRCPQ